MKKQGKIWLFAIAAIAAFAFFAEVFVPEVKNIGAPVGGGGEAIYNGKGACSVCHGATGVRAPLLDNIFATAEARLKDASYKGSARSVEEYIVESLTNPSVYIVKGYAVNNQSPMTDVRKPPAALTDAEIKILVEYLKTK